jgi:hypothetical protein
MQRCLADVHALLQLFITRFADFSGFGISRMVLNEIAHGCGGIGDLGVRRIKLRFELAKKLFSFLLQNRGINLCFGTGLDFRGRGQYRGNALRVVAAGTGVEVGGIVQVTFGAGHTVADRFSSGFD